MGRWSKIVSERRTPLIVAVLALVTQPLILSSCSARPGFWLLPLVAFGLVPLTLLLPRLGTLGQFLVIIAAVMLGLAAPLVAVPCGISAMKIGLLPGHGLAAAEEAAGRAVVG